MQKSTDSIPVVTDPFEIVAALCEAEEWELARRLARAQDIQSSGWKATRAPSATHA